MKQLVLTFEPPLNLIPQTPADAYKRDIRDVLELATDASDETVLEAVRALKVIACERR